MLYPDLLDRLHTQQQRLTQHLLFVSEETSTNPDITAEDPFVPLPDVLENLIRMRNLFYMRVDSLISMGFKNVRRPPEDDGALKRLLTLVEKPVGCETAATMLRAAAARLEDEFRADEQDMSDIEGEHVVNLAQEIAEVEWALRREREHGWVFSDLRGYRVLADLREMLATEPEDAVWAIADREAFACRDKIDYAGKLARGEGLYSRFCFQAACLGVRTAGRQTLIIEHLEIGGEDEEESEDGSEYTVTDEDEEMDEQYACSSPRRLAGYASFDVSRCTS